MNGFSSVSMSSKQIRQALPESMPPVPSLCPLDKIVLLIYDYSNILYALFNASRDSPAIPRPPPPGAPTGFLKFISDGLSFLKLASSC